MQKYLKVVSEPCLSLPDPAWEGSEVSAEKRAAGLVQAPRGVSLETSIRHRVGHGDQCPVAVLQEGA